MLLIIYFIHHLLKLIYIIIHYLSAFLGEYLQIPVADTYLLHFGLVRSGTIFTNQLVAYSKYVLVEVVSEMMTLDAHDIVS